MINFTDASLSLSLCSVDDGDSPTTHNSQSPIVTLILILVGGRVVW